MLTNNFINLSKLVMLGHDFSTTTLVKGRTVTGEERYFMPITTSAYPASDNMRSFTPNPASAGWTVGTGNTPATANDYQLETPINSGVSGSATINPINDSTLNRIIKKVSIIITNTGSTNISINEIGFKDSIYSNTAINKSGNNAIFLLYRTVLETPVTLTPGESTSFVIDFYVSAE